MPPHELLAGIETALLAAYPKTAVTALLDPLRAAIDQPASKRDPAALVPIFEGLEDVLEAALLARPSASAGG